VIRGDMGPSPKGVRTVAKMFCLYENHNKVGR
jgi:hypothetical protein